MRQSRPLDVAEPFRNAGVAFWRVVDNDRYQEGLLRRHVVGALRREFPLTPEITFEPLLRVSGDDRNEKRALLDLIPNLPIPGITAAQLALVEPHLDTCRFQRIGNALRHLGIL